MADFATALPFTLANEGGFVNDPNDAGGATNYGITQAVAEAYGYDGAMEDLDLDTASGIYEAEYWDSWNLSAIPSQGVATAIFDLHVNMGSGGAAKVVQAALKTLGWTGAQDGAWGPVTRAGVIAADPARLLPALSAAAAARYQAIAAANPDDAGFLRGWLNRAAALGTLAVGNPGTSALVLLAVGGLALYLTRRA